MEEGRYARSRSSRAAPWVLVGAAWGLLSVLPALASHWYFEALGYRLGRILTWLLPSRYAVGALDLAGITNVAPAWVAVAAVAVGGTVIGAAAALGAAWLVDRLGVARASGSRCRSRS